jgi:hypothetical protein
MYNRLSMQLAIVLGCLFANIGRANASYGGSNYGSGGSGYGTESGYGGSGYGSSNYRSGYVGSYGTEEEKRDRLVALLVYYKSSLKIMKAFLPVTTCQRNLWCDEYHRI